MLSNMCQQAILYNAVRQLSNIQTLFDSCKLQLQASNNNNKLSRNIKTRLLSKQYQTLFDSSKLSNIKRSKRLTKNKKKTYHVVVAPRCRRRRPRRPSLKRSPQRAKRLSEGYNRPSAKSFLQKQKKKNSSSNIKTRLLSKQYQTL